MTKAHLLAIVLIASSLVVLAAGLTAYHARTGRYQFQVIEGPPRVIYRLDTATGRVETIRADKAPAGRP
jgi:hypothetical protein